MERVLHHVGLKAAKSKADLLSQKEYPTDAYAYALLDDCGRGVSATVHRARVKETGEIVAVKKMNLESINCNLEDIIHEAQTMRKYHHPNVLPLYCSFVQGEDLWMVMPYIAGGSILNIMKYAFPEGCDEMTIATIMKEVLKGLDYVHKHGGIHRDIKAGNILIDEDGTVKLADFGVAATTERSGSWNSSAHQRHTFVGTPCWMAPEVMEQTQGYDSSADIWSFGITLLEMAHGHAPFAKFPPMKVLLMTLQNPPPTLDDQGKKHYSKHMKEVVSKCLQKDPKLRPKAETLLEHKFFRQAKDEDYLKRCVLAGLPQLTERVRLIRQGKAASSAEENDRRAEKSAEEYAKGVSAWNFDMARLKAQASLIGDDDAAPTTQPTLPVVIEGEPSSLGTSMCCSPDLSTAASLASAPVSRTGTFPSDVMTQALNELAQNEPALVGPEIVRRPSNGPANGKLTSVFGPTDGAPSLATTSVSVTVPATHSRSNLASLYSDPQSTDGSVPPLEPATSSSLAPTPKLKKTNNRFKVYEGGDDIPPLSPVTADRATAEARPVLLTSSEMGLLGATPLDRPSIDRSSVELARVVEEAGPRVADERPVAEKVDDEGAGAGKRKGRFFIKEEDAVQKSSLRSVSVTTESGVGSKLRHSDSRNSLVSASPSSTTGNMSMVPMLNELLEHSNQQSRALQRAMAALKVYEETGKVQWPTMSRSTSNGRLPSIIDWRESLLLEVDTMRDRVGELEKKVRELTEENARLKASQSLKPDKE